MSDKQQIIFFRIILLFSILTCNVLCRPEKVSADKLVNQFMQHNIPGCFVAVVQDNKVVYQKGFGVANVETSAPLTNATCMELGSVGKAFTAEVIYSLDLKNRLRLQDSIARFLNVPDIWNGVTVQHLLDHTSGIKNYLLDPRFLAEKYFDPRPGSADSLFKSVPSDSMLMMFYSLPLEFKPGEHWSYSNTGYYLLGKIAEAVSGKSFEALVNEVVTHPLNMSETSSNDSARAKNCVATGYIVDGEIIHEAKALTMNYAFSAGAWATSGEDMISYIKGVHQRNLPSALYQNVDSLCKKISLPFAYSGGKFFSRFHGMNIVSHQGGTPGFSSSWIYVPEKKISVIVLANRQDYAPIDHLAWDVLASFEPSLTYPSSPVDGQDEKKSTALLQSVLEALKTGKPMPSALSAQLKFFLESEGGRALWKWYFFEGFPTEVQCVDKEVNGSVTTYRFRLPLSEQVEYRLTFVVHSGKAVQLRWW